MRISRYGVALALGTCMAAHSAAAYAQQRFNIPAGSLKSALDAFGTQASSPAIYREDDIQGATSAGFVGQSPPATALVAILNGTGFAAKSDQSGAVAIVRSVPRFSQAKTEQPPAGEGLGEIIVTAQKNSENLQKAPAAIVAVGGDDLIQRGITDLTSLAKALPSANMRNLGPQTLIFIRGIGTRTGTPNFSNSVALMYNGVPLSRRGGFGIGYDVERVESIAGPQGTLYGGSAAAGAVNILSARPKNDFSGYARAEYGSYNSFDVAAAQNVAIGPDVSLRAAGNYLRRDSFYNIDVEEPRQWAGHLAALIEPADNFRAHVFFNHARDYGAPQVTSVIVSDSPRHPFRLPKTGPNGNVIDPDTTYQNNRNDILGADISFDLAGGTLTYKPAYLWQNAELLYYTGTSGGQLYLFDRVRQNTQELQYNTDLGPVKLTLGAFYLNSSTHFKLGLKSFSSPTASTFTQNNNSFQDNENYSFFAQGVVSVTDSLRVTLGGRYSHDKVEATGVGVRSTPIDFKHSKSRLDYRIGADYDLAPSILVYANLQSAYVPFGYNPDVTPNEYLPPSKLLAMSGGFKSRFLDNRVQLNVEAYNYLYKDYQAIAFNATTAVNTVLGSKRTKIYGVDVNLRALLTDDLSIYGSIVAQRARHTDFQGPGYNFSGNKMVNAPDFNFQGGIENIFPLPSGAKITARVDTQFSGSYYGQFTNFATQRQDSFHRTDAALIYSPESEKWNLQFFVKNIENAVVYGSITGGSATAPAAAGLEPPRVFGAKLTVRWP